MTSDKSASPFANLGLDKALLRSTQSNASRTDATTGREEATESPASQPKEKRARTRARVGARADTGVDTLAHAASDASTIEALYRQLQAKQRLASQTFRFQPDELAALERVAAAVKGSGARSLSKNDLVRLGLNWLIDDYDQHGQDSVLAKVCARL
jgi:hypothetical protein